MDTFIKNPEEVYELVYDFSDLLSPGEVIRTYTVYLDFVPLSGTYPSGAYVYPEWSGEFPDWSGVLPSGYNVVPSGGIYSHELFDKDTVLVGVSGAYDYNGDWVSGYMSSVSISTNRATVFTRDVWVEHNPDDITPSYNNLYYRIQTSWEDQSIYILPRIGEGFIKNQEYQVSVAAGISGVFNYTMSSPYSFWFTSEYCPLFTTVKSVKLLGGPWLDGFTDDTIYRMIHKNSLDAIDIANANGGTSLPYDYWGCGPDGIPYELRRYVECKTAYDLLTLIRMMNATGYSQTKTLGDMTIKYGGAPGGTSQNVPPDRTKELYDCFMGIMNNLLKGSGVQYAVRGYNDYSKGYPHPMKDHDHNRIVRSVPPHRSNLRGPHTYGRYWRWRSSNLYGPGGIYPGGPYDGAAR